MDGKDIRNIIGRNIRIFRSRRNWSQMDLSHNADVSQNFIGEIERGQKWPHPDILAKLSDAFQIKIYELFQDESDLLPIDIKTILNRLLKDVYLLIQNSFDMSVDQSFKEIAKQYHLEIDKNFYFL